MNYPTHAEIHAAFDGITADGERSEVTINLCTLVIIDPLLRQTMDLTTRILDDQNMFTGAAAKPLRESFVTSCIAKGMNIGLRISDARQAGMRSRQSIEDLLAHYVIDECTAHGSPDAVAQVIRVLQWVLGKPVDKQP